MGGVNSPSHSYTPVGGSAPLFMDYGRGGYLYDVDGNRYIDYLAAFGALILGHGHPRIAAAVACLDTLREENPYPRLDQFAARLEEGLLDAARRAGIPVQLNRVGGAFTLFFSERPIRNFADTEVADSHLYGLFFQELVRRGVLLPPSKYEAWFVQAPHTEADIEYTLAAARQAFAALSPGRSQ